MANHIYILYVLISFCTGMVFYVPTLVVYLQKGISFKYHNNYKLFFPAFTAFTLLIFSCSIYYYILQNIPEANVYVLISLIVIELVSIHLFLLFFPLFIHYYFSVKNSKIISSFFIILSLSSLIFFLIIFSGYYIGEIPDNLKKSVISFPIAPIYNGIFAIVIIYTFIICIFYFKNLSDDLLRKMAVTHLALILIFFFGMFIGLLFQSETGLMNSINMKIYILPGYYIVWNISSSYFCAKYFLFDPSFSSSAQSFSLSNFSKEYELTNRETEIVKLLLRGCGNTEISDELSISLPTVKSHLSNIFKKAGCSSRSELLSIIFHNV